MGEERRQPHNMKGLLNFCTELTLKEDAPNSSNSPAMDPERQEFLKNVMQSMTVNTAKQIAERLRSLADFNQREDHDEDDIEFIEQSLDNLLSVIDDMDCANDLVKMGGITVLLESLESSISSVRGISCEILGEISQNNPQSQQEMVALNALEKLLHLIDNDNTMNVKIKALHATSSTVRGYEPAMEQFEKLDGFSYLMRAMLTDSDKLIIKSAFLISNLVQEHAPTKDTMLSMGYTELLLSQLHDSIDENNRDKPPTSALRREHCTSALLKLCSSSQEARTICCNFNGFIDSLKARLDSIQTLEEYQEEADYIKEILKLIISPSHSTETSSVNMIR